MIVLVFACAWQGNKIPVKVNKRSNVDKSMKKLCADFMMVFLSSYISVTYVLVRTHPSVSFDIPCPVWNEIGLPYVHPEAERYSSAAKSCLFR